MSKCIHRILTPFSFLYGTGVVLRNKLFDWNILQSKSFDLPILCVGNLAVGGTGKTPHTEYLIRLLQAQGLHIATLSRGYKRQTKGYLLSNKQSSAQEIGDEPYQMKIKYPDVKVAVDENRCHGIEQLMSLNEPEIDVIILDDAYQHRYVKPGLTLLLTDYHRLFSNDSLLPAGRLREPASGKRRAQIVIVSKCPNDISEARCAEIAKQLQLSTEQELYFSAFRYGELRNLFNANHKEISLNGRDVLLLTGIASPTPLMEEVKSKATRVELMAFADHHDFSFHEMQQIAKQFETMDKQKRIVVTTEKDAARLIHHPALPEELKPHIYVLPIEVEILQGKQEMFNQHIIEYVTTNPRNSHLHPK